jgi:hypothetical protein
LSGVGASLSFYREIKAWAEVLKGFAVILSAGNHGTEHGRERMPRHTKPIGPRAVLACFVNNHFPDIKKYCLNGRHRTSSRHGLLIQQYAESCTSERLRLRPASA